MEGGIFYGLSDYHSAAANEGYRFAGWEISAGQEKETIAETSLELEIPVNGLHVKAVFEREGSGK